MEFLIFYLYILRKLQLNVSHFSKYRHKNCAILISYSKIYRNNAKLSLKLSSGNAYVLFSRNKFSSFLNTLPIFFLPPIHQPIDKKLGPLEVIICFQSPCFRLVLERCRIRKYFVNLPIPVEVV